MKELTVTLKQEGTDLITNREDFAVAVKTWRIRHGMTQKELAAAAGISRYTIMRVENASNETSWITMYKLFNLMADR